MELNPVLEDGTFARADAIDYLDTWRAMEELMRNGKIRSIGVSNFNSQQIDRLLSVAKITPAMNQIECHVNFNQHKLLKFCADRNITVTAYSPLGRPNRGTSNLAINHPQVAEIAAAHNKSPNQVVLRYTVCILKANLKLDRQIKSSVNVSVPKWSYCYSKINEQGPHKEQY